MREMTPTQRLNQARAVVRDLERRRASRKDALWQQVRDLEAKLNAQLAAEFDALQRAANNEAVEARQAYDAERVATAAERALYPIGTVLYRWKDRSGTWSRTTNYQKTGETAVVEVFTEESEWPANQVYGKPEIGDIVIRPRKKDGTSGAKCLREGSWDAREWCAEGETPETRRKAKEAGVEL